jgi:DNA adenine methylase
MGERQLIRWAGSKHHLVDRVAPMIRAYLDATGGRLISPFYGAGAIERAIDAECIAADACRELTAMWLTLSSKDGVDDLHSAIYDIAALAGRSVEGFRKVAGWRPGTVVMIGARFVWLNRFSFNGIWRVNRAGVFNGQPDPARIARSRLPTLAEICNTALRAPRRFSSRWQWALSQAVDGDLILSDPPYFGTFSGYTPTPFGRQEHEDLAIWLHAGKRRGAAVIAFNSPEAAPLYSWASTTPLARSGRMSSKAAARGAVAELMFTAGLNAKARSA